MIKEGVKLIIKGLGEDINRGGLRRTPERVADMYEEVFSGIGKDPSKELGPEFDENHDEIILVKDIPFYSVCEHHIIPFIGRAHIAYIPNESGKIVGLSKLVRVIDVVSKRLQIQEILTTCSKSGKYTNRNYGDIFLHDLQICYLKCHGCSKTNRPGLGIYPPVNSNIKRAHRSDFRISSCIFRKGKEVFN